MKKMCYNKGGRVILSFRDDNCSNSISITRRAYSTNGARSIKNGSLR